MDGANSSSSAGPFTCIPDAIRYEVTVALCTVS